MIADFQEANPRAGRADGAMGNTTLPVVVDLALKDVEAGVGGGWGARMWEHFLLPGLPYDESVVRGACDGAGGGGGGGPDYEPHPNPNPPDGGGNGGGGNGGGGNGGGGNGGGGKAAGGGTLLLIAAAAALLLLGGK